MKKTLALCGAALLLLSACRAPEPTPVPASTVAVSPPPAAPTAPATLVPFPTMLPTTLSAPTLSPVVSAMSKTKGAQKYRVAMRLDVQPGSAPPFALDLNGAVSGDDAQYTYRLGGAPVEYIAARGQFFVKGAPGLGLPSQTKWYMLTPDLADAVLPPFTPREVLGDFIAQAIAQNFQALAREALDGQICQVWRYVPKTFAETGIGSALGSEREGSPFSALDQAEIQVWTCEDGALHRFSVEVAAHNARRASEKSSARLLLHLWDIQSAAIQIEPPANAQPFQLRVPTPQ